MTDLILAASSVSLILAIPVGAMIYLYRMLRKAKKRDRAIQGFNKKYGG